MPDILGPLDREPRSIRPPFDQPDPDDPIHPMLANTSAATQQWRADVRAYREDVIREALVGVGLGTYDERMIAWLAGWDVGTVGTVVSWLHRVRQTAGSDRPSPDSGDTP